MLRVGFNVVGWPAIGRGGLRALWHVDRGLSWPTIASFGRLPRQPSPVCVSPI